MNSIEKPLAPRESRWREFWRLLQKEQARLPGTGHLCLFLSHRACRPRAHLRTKARSSILPSYDWRRNCVLLSPAPHVESLTPEAIPRLGIYLFGTDDLGRDVFARMMQGAWVSLTVGFVAVGISVLIGIILGGISGYYGQNAVTADQVIAAVVIIAGIGLLVAKAITVGDVAPDGRRPLFHLSHDGKKKGEVG